MDGLPLALTAAGSHLFQTTVRCRDYLQGYENHWLQLPWDSPKLPSYRKRLHSCWALIYHQLIKSSETLHLLNIWACIDSQDVWFELLDGFVSFLSEEDGIVAFTGAIKSLSDYGLVTTGPDPGDEGIGSRGYSLQRPFHAWLVNFYRNQRRLDVADRALSAVTRCSEHLIRSGKCSKGLLRLLPHASRCFDLVVADKINFYRFPSTVWDDTLRLINLARVFYFAASGETPGYHVYLQMFCSRRPSKVHLIKSKTLLSLALRKIEQVGSIEDAGFHSKTWDYHVFSRLKLLILGHLRLTCRWMSELQEVGRISRQMAHLYRLTSQDWEARKEEIRLWASCFVPEFFMTIILISSHFFLGAYI